MRDAVIRGIDHVGVTVPDIEMATNFFARAFGAEIIYDALGKGEAPQTGPQAEQRLSLAPGTAIVAIRMLRVGNGPGIELFEMQTQDRHPAARASDYGLQHLAVYVDDMESARAKVRSAGAELLGEARELPSKERGKGNLFCYARAPFGMLMELITYPSVQPYTTETERRRWNPTLLSDEGSVQRRCELSLDGQATAGTYCP